MPHADPVVFDLWGYWADDADTRPAWPDTVSATLNGRPVLLPKVSPCITTPLKGVALGTEP
jgi:hypothetical protein